jgi:glutaredoxin
MRQIRFSGTSNGFPKNFKLPPMTSRINEQQNPPSVVLYTRTGCHLCEDARRVLAENGLTPTSVDIDADPELRNQFDTCVPVVEIDGRIRFLGRIEPILLRRILANHARREE